MKSRIIGFRVVSAAAMVVTAAFAVHADAPGMSTSDWELRDAYDSGVRYTDAVDFPQRIGARGDVESGRANFGLAADGHTIDTSQALFEGDSQIAGTVHSNGRACISCHLPEHHFGLPGAPISANNRPENTALVTGLTADSQGDPLGPAMLEQFALFRERPGRFNVTLSEDNPLRQFFAFRKSMHILNTVFTFGLLNEGRAREMVETARGAAFGHTQPGDLRFDDITNVNNNQRLRDIGAFVESQIDPPELAALLDPSNPMYRTLVDDPFYTVHPRTELERRGEDVFARNCMSCHNMPNVFSNRDHINGNPLDFPPGFGHTFDIGVAERNLHHLEFRRYDPSTGGRVPIVVPLAAQDGRTVNVTVVDDIGLAATTARYEDLHRFKVPQLRHVAELAPYFHDNSANTLEEVVDYFNSNDYNDSVDGSRHPIHLGADEREALLAFLRIL